MEKGGDGFNAFQIIENAVVFIGRVQCIRIQAKTHQNGFEAQFFFEK
ncbi:MAG: hypothetical protein RIS78_845, partial [Bacteroidota bacterium]